MGCLKFPNDQTSFFSSSSTLRKDLVLTIRIDPSYNALSRDKNKPPDSGFLNLTLIYLQQKVHV